MSDTNCENLELKVGEREALERFDRELAGELDERVRAERESLEKVLDAVFEDQAVVVGKVE